MRTALYTTLLTGLFIYGSLFSAGVSRPHVPESPPPVESTAKPPPPAVNPQTQPTEEEGKERLMPKENDTPLQQEKLQ